ncbi:hypothetical protein PGB90_003963 [Kerria lacca]
MNLSNSTKTFDQKVHSKIARLVNTPLEKSVCESFIVNYVNNVSMEDTDNFIVGDRVWVGGSRPGVIAFIGETHFGPGDWAGIVLDTPSGKNDGAVAGIRYFQCAPNKGIFSRLSRLSRTPLKSNQTEELHSHLSENIKTISSNVQPVNIDQYYESSGPHLTTAPVNISQSSFNDTDGNLTTNIFDLKIGNRVIVQSSQGSKAGILKYYGNTEFGPGLWCGVELDDPLGKNDGSVAGIRYFECLPNFGLFVPVEKVSRSPVSKMKVSCAIHPKGISRQGTFNSLQSSSTVQTNLSGIKNNRKLSSKLSGKTTTSMSKSPLQVRVVKIYYPDWESKYY